MDIDQNLIARIASEVMARVQKEASTGSGGMGIFATIDEAVEAARLAQKQLRKLTIEKREVLITAMRDAAYKDLCYSGGNGCK